MQGRDRAAGAVGSQRIPIDHRSYSGKSSGLKKWFFIDAHKVGCSGSRYRQVADLVFDSGTSANFVPIYFRGSLVTGNRAVLFNLPRSIVVRVLSGIIVTIALVSCTTSEQSRSSEQGLVSPNTVKAWDASYSLKQFGPELAKSPPVSIVVVGDSDGDETDEWVFIVADTIARRGRAVTVNSWSMTELAYVTSRRLAPFEGPPVTIWNASAVNGGAAYSLRHLEAMVPSQSDLMIINHGHIENTADQALSGIRRIVQSSTSALTAVVLQSPVVGPRSDSQREISAAVRSWFEFSDVALIDVESAFLSAPPTPALISVDGLHMTNEGQMVWGAKVLESLGLPSSSVSFPTVEKMNGG